MLEFNVHTPDEEAKGDLDARFFVGIFIVLLSKEQQFDQFRFQGGSLVLRERCKASGV